MPVFQECLEARTKVSTRLEPTAIGGELWIACEGKGVRTGGRAHNPFFLFWQCGPRSSTRVQVFVRMLGHVLIREPTVILTVPTEMCTADN